jgi:hypothetical protein
MIYQQELDQQLLTVLRYHDELDEAVEKILSELGVNGRPRLRVLNKIDQLSAEDKKIVSNGTGGKAGQAGAPVLVSALTGEGIEELLRRMDAAMPTDAVVTLSMRLPLGEGRTLALIHALGRVLHSEVEDSHMRLDAGGIGMGYAVDEAFKVLKREGIPSALIDARKEPRVTADVINADHLPGTQCLARDSFGGIKAQRLDRIEHLLRDFDSSCGHDSSLLWKREGSSLVSQAEAMKTFLRNFVKSVGFTAW